LPTLKTELRAGRKLSAARSALEGETNSTLQAELRPRWILMLAARTLHVKRLH
jgi:hypothetical protein